MPNIDPRITVPEGQIIHKRIGGHNHDGIVSSLIDTSSYSIFDFTMGVRETNLTTTRGRRQQSNELAFKSLVVAAVEERVLNPQGITLKANSITSNEIAANTIKADNLSANLILVNNIIRSNNYQSGPLGANGWIIYSNGKAEFNDVTIRGNIFQGNGNYQNNDTKIFANTGGYFSLGSNLAWNGNTLTIRGSLQFADGSTPGTFDDGDALTGGTIGGITISPSSISGSGANGSFAIYSNGYATFNDALIGSDDGTNGVFISRDGFLTGLAGSGIRIRNVSDSVTGVQLFGNLVYSPRVQATEKFETFVGVTSVYIYPSGVMDMVAESPSQMIDMKRNYGAGANFIRFVNGNTSSAVGAIEFNNTTTINYRTSSDFRLKTKIKKMQDGIGIVKKINPVEYEWINTDGEKGKGFIAQELYEVYPEAVSVGSDDVKENPWGIDYGKLTPVLTAAIKELIEKVEYLENRLNEIEGV